MLKIIHKAITAGLLICSLNSLSAFAPTNFFRPYDAAIRLPLVSDAHAKFGARVEYGDQSTGRNSDSKKRNILSVHDDNESVLKMIVNPVGTLAANQQLTGITTELTALAPVAPVLDDGVRGRQQFTGRFSEIDATFWGTYYFPFDAIPGTLSMSLHLPVVSKKVSNVLRNDLTLKNSLSTAKIADDKVHALLTDNLESFVKTVGNLDLSSWNDSGLGDLVLMFDWWRGYRQDKDYLKWVTLLAKVGVSFPTSKEKNEDRAFSMPLGNDGSWGLPVGIGMELDFVHNIKAGLDADFSVLFDKKRTRRLKTDPKQTEFLLLNKGVATKEHGLMWQFHLFVQAYHFFEGLSAKFAYQFVKHDDDRLVPAGNDFDYSIVNSGNSVKEWTNHNLIFSLNCDLFTKRRYYRDEYSSSVTPQLHLFYKLSVGGKNVIDTSTVGGQVGVHF